MEALHTEVTVVVKYIALYNLFYSIISWLWHRPQPSKERNRKSKTRFEKKKPKKCQMKEL
jgi:hypothetical protein